MVQIVSGLQFLHRRNIVHLDIKPDNILLDYSGNVKIADLELAEVLLPGNKINHKDLRGCRDYEAPELRYKTSSNPDFKAADIWALGMTFATILLNKFPFNYRGQNRNELYMYIFLNFGVPSKKYAPAYLQSPKFREFSKKYLKGKRQSDFKRHFP